VVRAFNPAAERMFGYPAAEVVGRKLKRLMPAPYAQHHDDYIGRYLRTGRAHVVGVGREVIGRRRDGTLAI
jgi:PAS domain S-box-containing protein